MIEKVNPMHPDKIADRIAGAIVDLCYKKEENPKVAVEVLIGHGRCHIIIESSVNLKKCDIEPIVERIGGKCSLDLLCVPQDKHLADNQKAELRCGDNGIFKGVPVTEEQRRIRKIAEKIYDRYSSDGKYILDEKNGKLIVCQSNANSKDVCLHLMDEFMENDHLNIYVNPLGQWTGGLDVDTGATNRKLGSDMADSVTGGGLHGKDLSKADVSVNIYAFLKAQVTGEVVELCCAIGDQYIDGKPYKEIVDIARTYINYIGGFEKFAEWGLF